MFQIIKKIFEAYQDEGWDNSHDNDQVLTASINDYICHNSPITGLKRLDIPVDLSDKAATEKFITNLKYNIDTISSEKKWQTYLLDWIETAHLEQLTYVNTELIEYYCLYLIIYSVYIKDSWGKNILESLGLNNEPCSLHSVNAIKNRTIDYKVYVEKNNPLYFDFYAFEDFIVDVCEYIKFIYRTITGRKVYPSNLSEPLHTFYTFWGNRKWNWDIPWNWHDAGIWWEMDWRNGYKDYLKPKIKWIIGNTEYKLDQDRIDLDYIKQLLYYISINLIKRKED